jgi:fucose permease
MGIEVSLGGWTVLFMMDIRHGPRFASGIVNTGLWAGLTAGRMVLEFVTGCLFPSEQTALTVGGH